jgi:hypothetical protein
MNGVPTDGWLEEPEFVGWMNGVPTDGWFEEPEFVGWMYGVNSVEFLSGERSCAGREVSTSSSGADLPSSAAAPAPLASSKREGCGALLGLMLSLITLPSRLTRRAAFTFRSFLLTRVRLDP